jgi:hypothetical protein
MNGGNQFRQSLLQKCPVPEAAVAYESIVLFGWLKVTLKRQLQHHTLHTHARVMPFPHAVAVNNAAVEMLRSNRSAEAIILLESAWVWLRMHTPCQAIEDSSNRLPSPPQDAQVREVLQQPPHLIPPSRCESPCPGAAAEDDDSTTSLPLPPPPRLPTEFPTQGFSTLPTMMRMVLSRVDVVIKSVPIDGPLCSLISMSEDANHKVSPGNYFSIYKRAFLMDVHDREMDLLGWLRCVPHMPAVLLYNTGLVFHLLALQTGSTSVFLKALELYKLSMIILEDNAKNGFYVSELDILMLALTNNMGHCHSHFHNLDDVSMCLERMSKVFLLSVSTVLLSDDEYAFFYRVTLMSPHRTPVLAPAA